MHDGRAEATDEPDADAGVGNQLLVVHVLDDREARTGSEAKDRGVDQEPDPVALDEADDDERLGELLDHGRHVARVVHAVESGNVQEAGVHAVTDDRRDDAAGDDGDYEAQRDKLVTVEIEKRGQEAQHGREPDQQVEGDLDNHLHDLERDHPLGAHLV